MPYVQEVEDVVTQFSEYDGTGSGATERIRKNLTWSQNGGGFYVSQLVTTVEPGASQKQKTTTQEVDVYGNMTQQKVYDWGLNSGTPLRLYTNSCGISRVPITILH